MVLYYIYLWCVFINSPPPQNISLLLLWLLTWSCVILYCINSVFNGSYVPVFYLVYRRGGNCHFTCFSWAIIWSEIFVFLCGCTCSRITCVITYDIVTWIIPEKQINFEWVSDCYLMPNSAILWRQHVNFQWDDDVVRFVLDQHA